MIFLFGDFTWFARLPYSYFYSSYMIFADSNTLYNNNNNMDIIYVHTFNIVILLVVFSLAFYPFSLRPEEPKRT